MPYEKKIRIFHDVLINTNIYYGTQNFNELMKNNFWNSASKVFLKIEFIIRIHKIKKQIYLNTICYQICFSN